MYDWNFLANNKRCALSLGIYLKVSTDHLIAACLSENDFLESSATQLKRTIKFLHKHYKVVYSKTVNLARLHTNLSAILFQ
jgi:hypothetical protein